MPLDLDCIQHFRGILESLASQLDWIEQGLPGYDILTNRFPCNLIFLLFFSFFSFSLHPAASLPPPPSLHFLFFVCFSFVFPLPLIVRYYTDFFGQGDVPRCGLCFLLLRSFCTLVKLNVFIHF